MPVVALLILVSCESSDDKLTATNSENNQLTQVIPQVSSGLRPKSYAATAANPAITIAQRNALIPLIAKAKDQATILLRNTAIEAAVRLILGESPSAAQLSEALKAAVLEEYPITGTPPITQQGSSGLLPKTYAATAGNPALTTVQRNRLIRLIASATEQATVLLRNNAIEKAVRLSLDLSASGQLKGQAAQLFEAIKAAVLEEYPIKEGKEEAFSKITEHNGILYNECEKEFSWIKGQQIGKGGVGSIKVACRKSDPKDCRYVAKIQPSSSHQEIELDILSHLNNSGITPRVYENFNCYTTKKPKRFYNSKEHISIIIMERFSASFNDILIDQLFEDVKGNFNSINDLINHYKNVFKDRVVLKDIQKLDDYFNEFLVNNEKLNSKIFYHWIFQLKMKKNTLRTNTTEISLQKSRLKMPFIFPQMTLTENLKESLARIAVLLEQLSKKRIISRDMKSDNILYDKEMNNFVLTDFGTGFMEGNKKSANFLAGSFWEKIPRTIRVKNHEFDYMFDAVSGVPP